jgi:hypothetical protein
VVGIVPVIGRYDVDVTIAVTVYDDKPGDKREIITLEVPMSAQGSSAIHGIARIVNEAVARATFELAAYVDTLAEREKNRLK